MDRPLRGDEAIHLCESQILLLRISSVNPLHEERTTWLTVRLALFYGPP